MNSPTGQRMLTKPYPKDNEPRIMGLPPQLVTQLGDYIASRRLKPGDLLFATRESTPISRNTFRTRVWRPAVTASGIDFDVRVHDLRTPTPPGCSQAAPTSSPAWTAWSRSDHHHSEVPPHPARRRPEEPRRTASDAPRRPRIAA